MRINLKTCKQITLEEKNPFFPSDPPDPLYQLDVYRVSDPELIFFTGCHVLFNHHNLLTMHNYLQFTNGERSPVMLGNMPKVTEHVKDSSVTG